MVAEAKNENQTTLLSTDTTTKRRTDWVATACTVILLVYIAFLLFYRLAVYPAPNFDEGAFLKVAKNYELNGIYADFSLGENRYTGAVVSTGPTVILPIALLFKVFGPSIVLGRLVEVIYAALLLFAVYALGTQWQDRRFGLFAIVTLLFLNRQHFELSLRSLLGEIPGLFFMFAGLWLWLRPGKRRLVELVFIGVMFGCSAITKNQYAPIILGGIFVSWMADLFWYRRHGPLNYIVPGLVAGLCYAGWTYYVLFLLGAHERNVAADFQLLRSVTTNSLILFNSGINNTNLTTLMQDNLFLIPALVFGLILFLRRDAQEQRWSILVIFLLISVVMFIFSNGWQRYEVTPQILAALIVARLAYNLTNGFYLNLQDWRNALRGKQLTVAATITLFVVTLMAGQIFRPLYLQATDVATSGTNAPYLVQQYLDEAVPRNAVIATFESSLGVLTNHAYKFAPYSLVVDLTVKQPVGIPVNTTLYSFLFAQNPEYVIIGPFAESIDPNVSERMKVAYDLIFKADDYEVYRWKGQTF